MKTLIYSLFLVCPLFICAQTEKGASGINPISDSEKAAQSTTHAVVIGISDYQNESIPDLRFADKDAEAFAKYLQSPAGGEVPDENIKLLTNQQATMAAVAAELDWLVETSEEGDKAIIYFSGHGDVEAKTARQPGFLLTYDSPPKIYIAGAYPLFYLQLVVETLSSDKNVQTVVITDACRAGKLAGSEIGGTQATASNLAKQYANEIKILSCQPDEFSLEGEQWGGGRGAFSYHLIEGLIGLADKNENGQVNLLELENYLETMVPEETDPQSQIPMTVGSKGTKVAQVDGDVLAKLKDLKSKQLPTLAAIESKGFEETLLANVDSVTQKKYDSFLAALGDKNLLDAEAGQASADDLYRELMEKESLSGLHRFMTRQFATALQDDAQQAINDYLLANPTEMAKRWEGDATYGIYPRYLGRAAELLGEGHYMHDYLIAKKLYFEGLNLRLQADQGTIDKVYEQAIVKLDSALQLEDRAAYFYNELGVLHTRLTLSEKARAYYEKAIELAPEWALPYINYSLESFYSNEKDKAIEYGNKALELMPDYPQLYNLMGGVYAGFWDHLDKRVWPRKGVELKEDFRYGLDEMSTATEKRSNYANTINLLQKAIQLDSNYVSAQYNLGYIYRQIDENEKAAIHLKKSIALDSLNWKPYQKLGEAYRGQRKWLESEAMLKKAIELTLTDGQKEAAYNSLAITYNVWGKAEQSLAYYQKIFDINPEWSAPLYNASWVYFNKQYNYKKAEWFSLKGLQHGTFYTPYFRNTGDLYEAMGRFQDAEWMYLTAIRKLPDYRRGYIQLINLYRRLGKKEQVKIWQQKLLAIAPDDPEVLLSIGKVAYLDKQFEQAERHFENALALTPDKFDYSLDIGQFYYVHGESKVSEKYLKEATRWDDTGIPRINLAFLYHDNQEFKKAENEIQQASMVAPEDEFVIYNQVVYYLLINDVKKANKSVAKLIDLNPEYTQFKKAFNAYASGDYKQSASLYENMIADGLGDSDIRYLYAKVKIKLGQNSEALTIFRRVIKPTLKSYQFLKNDTALDPIRQLPDFKNLMRQYFPEKYDEPEQLDNGNDSGQYFVENCFILADLYEKLQNLERAEELYQKAVELRPTTLTDELALDYAQAYLKLGAYEEAQSVCPDAIESEDEKVLFHAGDLFYQLGNTEAAKTHFDKYLLASKEDDPESEIGHYYRVHGDFALAETFYKKAIKADPDGMGSYWGLGFHYAAFGKNELAYQTIGQAIQLEPGNLFNHYFNALFHYMDQPQESRKYFERAGFAAHWDCLELMRTNQYEKADLAWKELQKNYPYFTWPDCKYHYAQMKIRQGEMDLAIQLIEEVFAEGVYKSYELHKNDSELDPIRELPRFQEIMRKYFPEKTYK